MLTRVLRRFLWGGALLFLAGCGVTATTAASCASAGTGAATLNGTAVTIGTDHSTYTQSASIVVTVTNTQSTPIYAANHQASCTILRMEQQVNGQWQAASNGFAKCAQGIVTRFVEIAPGQSYTGSITAASANQKSATFATGTYRLALTYFATPPSRVGGGIGPLPPAASSATSAPGSGITQPSKGVTMYSAPFSIAECVDTIRGTAPAGAGSTSAPAGEATPIMGTAVPVGTSGTTH